MASATRARASALACACDLPACTETYLVPAVEAAGRWPVPTVADTSTLACMCDLPTCTEPYLVPAVEAAMGRVLGAAQVNHVAAARSMLMMDLLPGQAGEPLLVGVRLPRMPSAEGTVRLHMGCACAHACTCVPCPKCGVHSPCQCHAGCV